MTVALDLNKRHWTRVRGPLTAVGTWYSDGKRWRPCMAIYRTSDELSTERLHQMIPCVIQMDRAWVWEETAGDGREAARLTMQFLRALRVEFDPKNARWLHSFIADCLGDLLTIPPYTEPGEAVADVTITSQLTGKSREVVLRDV